MTKLWCKLWNFVLNIFTSVVDGIGYALSTIGTVLVDVLGAVADAVGEALGIDGSTVLWLGIIGVGAYFLFFGPEKEEKNKKDKKNPPQQTVGVKQHA